MEEMKRAATMPNGANMLPGHAPLHGGGMRTNGVNAPIADGGVRTDGVNATAPKFCPNCGKPTGGSRFCGECGTRLI